MFWNGAWYAARDLHLLAEWPDLSRQYAGPALPHPLEVNWRPIETGHWFLYARRGSAWVPARIWWCPHEPGDEENILDQPFLSGEIAGRQVDPARDIWMRVLLCETNPGHWSCAQAMVPKDGLTVEEEFAYQMHLLKGGHTQTKPIAKLRTLALPF